MKRTKYMIVLILILTGAIHAQNEPPDPIEQHMFPPELVMQNQRAIKLTDQQKSAIKKEIQQAQAQFTELEWDLQNEMEDLISELSQEQVEEQKALTVLQKVLDLESRIKKAQLTLVIHIKNILTGEQQARLREIKSGWVHN